MPATVHVLFDASSTCKVISCVLENIRQLRHSMEVCCLFCECVMPHMWQELIGGLVGIVSSWDIILAVQINGTKSRTTNKRICQLYLCLFVPYFFFVSLVCAAKLS